MKPFLGSLGHAVVALCLAASLQGPAGSPTVRESALIGAGSHRPQPNVVAPSGREWKPTQPGRLDSPPKATLVRPAGAPEARYRDAAEVGPAAPLPHRPASLAFSLYSIGPPVSR